MLPKLNTALATELGVKETSELIHFIFSAGSESKDKLADGKLSISEVIGLAVNQFSEAKAGFTGLQLVDDEFKNLTIPGQEFLVEVIDSGLAHFGATLRNREIALDGLTLLGQNIRFVVSLKTRPPSAVAVA